MELRRKVMEGVLKNSKNPKLAWQLVKRVMSSPSSASSFADHTQHLVTITTRILAGANMHLQLHDLHKLLLASQPHHIAQPSILSMVRILAQWGHIHEALTHFKSLRAQFPSSPPSISFYNLLLRSSIQHSLPNLVTWLYTDMIAARVTPQTYTFNLLIQSLCDSRAFDHAIQLFDKMSQKGCHPNEFTLGILVRGLCRAGRVKQALELVNNSYSNSNGNDNNSSCRIANRVVYNTLVSAFCKEELNDEAEKLVERMSEVGLLPDVVTFNSRISALCRAGKVLEASRIFRDMQMDVELGLPRPNVVTYNLMLKGFCKHGMIEGARGLVDTMKKAGNFVSLESYNIWLLGLLRNGELLEARPSDNWSEGVVEHLFSKPLRLSSFRILMLGNLLTFKRTAGWITFEDWDNSLFLDAKGRQMFTYDAEFKDILKSLIFKQIVHVPQLTHMNTSMAIKEAIVFLNVGNGDTI
ncbi:Pentatricopeptide repeat-containing protein [Vigna angularis]|uniref:Pentatricopeptide repeat-containing protein n=1 Tax=Phaseolus angularis TaxID=3914 RepID=A0A8T0LDI3_PHAAN|nr:Pentatricopeptide repeat-containing protein [Vigna angularis]